MYLKISQHFLEIVDCLCYYDSVQFIDGQINFRPNIYLRPISNLGHVANTFLCVVWGANRQTILNMALFYLRIEQLSTTEIGHKPSENVFIIGLSDSEMCIFLPAWFMHFLNCNFHQADGDNLINKWFRFGVSNSIEWEQHIAANNAGVLSLD